MDLKGLLLHSHLDPITCSLHVLCSIRVDLLSVVCLLAAALHDALALVFWRPTPPAAGRPPALGARPRVQHASRPLAVLWPHTKKDLGSPSSFAQLASSDSHAAQDCTLQEHHRRRSRSQTCSEWHEASLTPG